MKYDEQQNEYIDQATKVKKENYSFGPVYTIYYDIQFSVILHLEDIEAINALQDGEEYRFIEETNKRYLATRQGDFIFFDNPRNGTILKVPLSELAYDKHDTTNEALSPSDMDLLLPKKTNKRGVKASFSGSPEDLDILGMLEDEWMVPVDIEDVSWMTYKIRDIGVYLIDPRLIEDGGPGGITVTPKMLNKIGMTIEQFVQWLVSNDAMDKTKSPRDTKYDNFYAKNE